MERTIEGASGEAVAKRAMWLAWQACGGPLGMGFLHDRPNATEDEVWVGARGAADYEGSVVKQSQAGEAHADYVFGRMMKLSLEYTEDTISFRDEAPTQGYQAWCGVFPSYMSLIEAAAHDLGATLAEKQTADA